MLLLVDNMQQAQRFYTGVLGCRIEGKLPQYGMMQLRAGKALIDLVDIPRDEGAWARPEVRGGRNLDHLCIAISKYDEQALRSHLASHAVAIVEEGIHGGARGESLSLYVRDPSGNTIELQGPPSTPFGLAGPTNLFRSPTSKSACFNFFHPGFDPTAFMRSSRIAAGAGTTPVCGSQAMLNWPRMPFRKHCSGPGIAAAEFRGEADLDTWIHRIALNAAIDLMRRRKPQTYFQVHEEVVANLAMAAPAISPESEYVHQALEQGFSSAMQRLTPIEQADISVEAHRRLAARRDCREPAHERQQRQADAVPGGAQTARGSGRVARSTMISDNDLLLYHYGDGLDASERERIGAALRAQPELAARLQRLVAQLDAAVAIQDVPVPADVEQRWQHALDHAAATSRSQRRVACCRNRLLVPLASQP